MDTLTDLKLQAFALWIAENGIYFHPRTECWINSKGEIIADKASDLSKRYENEITEQYVS